MPQDPRRIVLYSHDTMGLGHTRRNLLIARALSEGRTPPAILMIFGASEARSWDMPPGTEGLTLPSVHKGVSGHYASRRMAVPFESVIGIRKRAIEAAIDAFDPDLMIVDKVPGGLAGELLPALRLLRRRGRARIVLGLRDVLDDAATVRSEWTREDNYRIVEECYDAVWVYGDPAIVDPVEEYGLGDTIARKLHFTGYPDPRLRLSGPAVAGGTEVTGPISLCLVGGGQDGAPLARAFAGARYPAGNTGVLVTGPQMPDAAHHDLVSRFGGRDDLRIVRFDPDADRLIARADHVIAMGGYNTVVEILAHERRALIVPRVVPRTEQLIRAERLAGLGLVDLLSPDLATSDALSDWLLAGTTPRARAHHTLDFGGLARINLLARALLVTPKRRRVRTDAGLRSLGAVG
ncbi:MAG: hypothetical protein IT352_07145 [Gemmatimonadales bacterium]|nr:hypothetical protein [Gemmatimonadales bacterium]